MSITPQQVAAFHARGSLLLEGCVSAQELAAARAGLPALLQARDERTIRERSGAAVRSIDGLHADGGALARLARHPRLVGAAQRLLGGEVYVYQSKLNHKAALVGDHWQWHQDRVYWREEDGMPAARVLTAAVFLDAVTEHNGPISVIPGSHRGGVLPCEPPPPPEEGPDWASHLSARLKYSVERGALTRLVRELGIEAPEAGAGAALLFHGDLVHASAANRSPLPRSLMLYTYNHVDNAPPRAGLVRPEFLVSRDTRPVAPERAPR